MQNQSHQTTESQHIILTNVRPCTAIANSKHITVSYPMVSVQIQMHRQNVSTVNHKNDNNYMKLVDTKQDQMS